MLRKTMWDCISILLCHPYPLLGMLPSADIVSRSAIKQSLRQDYPPIESVPFLLTGHKRQQMSSIENQVNSHTPSTRDVPVSMDIHPPQPLQ